MAEAHRPALVLSGGGVRGAYEAGVAQGIVEVLEIEPDDEPPFGVFAGTSVGAINTSYLAANAHRGDMNVQKLAAIWTGLDIAQDLKVDPLGLLGWPRLRALANLLPGDGRRLKPGSRLGKSLLDPRPLEHIVQSHGDFDQLHENVRSGKVRAVLVAALDVASGRTTMFVELAPGAEFLPSRDPRRQASLQPVTADHVLASAAIPLFFPARRIGNRYYADGGLRFNTPISPAIRTGVRRLCVVSLRYPGEEERPVPLENHAGDYPSLAFLIGKLLNALLLDPIAHDLQVLDRFNKLLEVVEETMTPEERDRLEQILLETRGAGYRRLETLVFMPSENIGALAADHVRKNLKGKKLDLLTRRLLKFASRSAVGREADLASYLLFDGSFAAKLVELGRRDVHQRADDVRAFFRKPDHKPG